MIADRREKLAEARSRHRKRIETLEKAQQRMLSDLRELIEAAEKETSGEENVVNPESLGEEGLQ